MGLFRKGNSDGPLKAVALARKIQTIGIQRLRLLPRTGMVGGITLAFIITMIICNIHSQLQSAHGFEPGRHPGVDCPSPAARPCDGLTSAIPPGTSFSKVKVGRPSSHRAG